MPPRRRGARTGRGWDAAPPRAGVPGQSSFARRRGTPAPAPPGSPDDGGSSGADAAGGRERSPADWAERAREICLRQLSVRPRTHAELATALRSRGVPDDIADEVLERYRDVGMVDDEAFARAWVSSRHNGRGLARRALGSELRRKGVNAEAITEALADLDEDTEARTARDLVDRKLRTERGAPDATFRRLVGMLARKGYPAGLAVRVVKAAMADREQTAGFADEVDTDALTAALEATDHDA
ncbi:regulatory protein RecX [Luedemannella helvata]|uniref:Regulatory protein RecX n=1 Tax=Luedemannella helvata TaxID=349315 RepID=A0ABN2KM23_9ACTN